MNIPLSRLEAYVKVQQHARAVLGLLAFAALASTAIGCGGDDSDTAASTGTSGTGGGGGGAGGAGGEGSGGAGGAGGSSSANYGPPSSETVNAGEVSKSPKYKMVYTLGQPTQNQGKSTSPAHRLQGGVIGATGSLK
ncbi:MAG: hypothetical protein L6Q76_03170 [Polyangiaceae bacterium]|nr:hypothetical protein [Polyangiaceae bacterium]